jgi:hypothetical protein
LIQVSCTKCLEDSRSCLSVFPCLEHTGLLLWTGYILYCGISLRNQAGALQDQLAVEQATPRLHHPGCTCTPSKTL